MNCIVGRIVRAKAELKHQKKVLRWLFEGLQNRKRGKEAQLECVRAEKRVREKSEGGRREESAKWEEEKGVEQPPMIVEEADVLSKHQENKENGKEDVESN